jgi:hypothetical protein
LTTSDSESGFKLLFRDVKTTLCFNIGGPSFRDVG